MTKRQLIPIIVASCLLLGIFVACLIILLDKNNVETSKAERETNKTYEYTYQVEIGDKINIFDIIGNMSSYTTAIDDELKFDNGFLYAIEEGTYKFTITNTDNNKYCFTIIAQPSSSNILIEYDDKTVDDLYLQIGRGIKLKITINGDYDEIKYEVSDNLTFSENILTANSIGNGYLEIMLIKNGVVVCNRLISVEAISAVEELNFYTDAASYYGETSISGNLILENNNLILSNLLLSSTEINFDIGGASYQSDNIIIPFTCNVFGEIAYSISYNNIFTTHSDKISASGTISVYKYINNIEFVVNDTITDQINLSLFDMEYVNQANNDGFYNEITYDVVFNEFSNKTYSIDYDKNVILIENNKIVALKEGNTTIFIIAQDGSNYIKMINVNVNKILPSEISYNGQTDFAVDKLFTLDNNDFEILPAYAIKSQLLVNGQNVEEYHLEYGTNNLNVSYGNVTMPLTINVYSKLKTITYNTHDFISMNAIEVFIYNYNGERVGLENFEFRLIDNNGNDINYERREGNFIFFSKELLIDGTFEIYNDIDKISTKITL